MPNTYTLIQEQIVTSNVGNILFQNIPQTYTDLVVHATARTSGAVTDTDWILSSINGDAGSNYSTQQVYGTGFSLAAQRQGTNAWTIGGNWTGANATANTFAVTRIYFVNYTAARSKPYLINTTTENNAQGANTTQSSGLWRSNSAIQSFYMSSAGGGNIVTGSVFRLYGIKNS